MSQSDDFDETLEQSIQMGSFVLMRQMEIRARQRERQMREAEAERRGGAERIYRRLMAERDAARSVHLATRHQRWWDRANPGEVAQAWTAAAQWSRVDSEAMASAVHIREEVRQRWGIDPDVTDLSSAEDIARARSEAARDTAASEQKREDVSRDEAQSEVVEDAEVIEEAEAVIDDPGAADEPPWTRIPTAEAEWQPGLDEVSREAQHRFVDDASRQGASREQADELWQRVQPQERNERFRTAVGDLRSMAKNATDWDSVERREAFAVSMEGVVSPVIIQARLRADLGQGRPAHEATAAAAPSRKKAAARTGPGRERERDGR